MRLSDATAKRLLNFSERHPLAGPFLLGLFLFLFAQLLLLVWWGHIPRDFLTLAAIEILLLLAGATIPLLLVLVAIAPAFARMVRISHMAQPHVRGFVQSYLDTTLTHMADQLKSLQSGAGLSLAVSQVGEVDGWLPAFFDSAQGQYVGLDATVPSTYLSRWRGFIEHLNAHQPGVRMRVITSPTGDLRKDVVANPDAARRLLKLHNQWEARLLCIDGQAVRSLAERHELPSTLVDLALWEGDYCLLWEGGVDRFTVRLCLESDPMYGRVAAFIEAIEEEAANFAQFTARHGQA